MPAGVWVHIHIGAQGHTPQSLRNLANIMASHESLIAEALKLDRGRMSRYCRTVDPRFWSRSTGGSHTMSQRGRTSGTPATAQATAGASTITTTAATIC